jgi:8-oxo-dGTP pyrophosphatase MutT (NUDIX family)
MTYRPALFPVSVKAVIVRRGKVLLLRNERDEWELPGGKLELGEDPPERLRQEIAEECGWEAKIGPILDAWQYHIRDGVDVLIVTYGAEVNTDDPPVLSHEHRQVGLFAEHEVADLHMPDGYKRSIADWHARLRLPAEQAAR